MKNFIDISDLSSKDLRAIMEEAKSRKKNRKSLNKSAENIIKIMAEGNLGKPLTEIFDEKNQWLVDEIAKVRETGTTETLEDANLYTGKGELVSANIALQPMISGEGDTIGALMLVEDISSEK